MLRQSEAIKVGVGGLTPWSKRPFITDGSIISLSSISRTFGPTTSVANRLTKEKISRIPTPHYCNRIMLCIADETGGYKKRAYRLL